MISTVPIQIGIREPAQRIGEWTRIGQRPVAYARGTERDRIGSVKGDRIGSVKGHRIRATDQGARMSVKGDDGHGGALVMPT